MQHSRLRAASASDHSASTLDHTPPSSARPDGDHLLPLWRRPLRWIGRNSFNPGWIGERRQHPTVGYLIATFLQLIAALATLVLVLVFPSFSFPEALPMLIVALVALNWGVACSIYATLLGTLLLETMVLPQTAHGDIGRVGDAVEIALVLAVGGVISIAASGTERARRKAERGRMQALAREMALRELSERTDEFLGVASHELRTPLTTITGALELSQRRLARHRCQPSAESSEQARDLAAMAEVLGVAEHEVNRQNRLIGDLLDASRIRADKLELRMEPVDLAPVVGEAVEAQRLAWPERAIELTMPAGDVLIQGDGQRLGQVVTNFLTNALKYSATDRPVAVELCVQDDGARVAVCDQGPGLMPKHQAVVWERFRRIDGIEQQSGSGAGLGLGLYICRTIIERHGGEVGVESTPGRGSTFWLRLPLAQVPE
jgi:signal transduction histidine kinase